MMNDKKPFAFDDELDPSIVAEVEAEKETQPQPAVQVKETAQPEAQTLHQAQASTTCKVRIKATGAIITSGLRRAQLMVSKGRAEFVTDG